MTRLEALKKTLIRYGVRSEQIPQQWTPEIESAAYAWIGRAVVDAELNPPAPRRRGRPKNTFAPDSMITTEAKKKRVQRSNLLTSGLSEEEWHHRWNMRQANKQKKDRRT